MWILQDYSIPIIFPSLSTSILSACGLLVSPGISITPDVYTTTSPAPFDIDISVIVIVVLSLFSSSLSVKEYGLFATHTYLSLIIFSSSFNFFSAFSVYIILFALYILLFNLAIFSFISSLISYTYLISLLVLLLFFSISSTILLAIFSAPFPPSFHDVHSSMIILLFSFFRTNYNSNCSC